MGYLSHLTTPKFRQESSVVARGQMVATKKDDFSREAIVVVDKKLVARAKKK